MNERMIAIPFEEYEELQNFKNMSQKENMLVYIRQERYELGHGSRVWFIYTKDEAVRKITDELIRVNKEWEKSIEQCKQQEEENEKSSQSKGNIVINILLLCVMVALMYLIFNIDYTL